METINIEAFEQSKGVYYIELPQGTYEIVEQNQSKTVNIGYMEKVIIDLDTKPEIHKLESYNELTHYEDKDGKILSTKEFKEVEQTLRKNEDDYGHFPNIDEEYLYKKFLQTWVSKYENKTVKKQVTYDIKFTQYNLPKYITPFRKLNGDLKNTLYVYNQAKHIRDLVQNKLESLGYKQAESEYTQLDNKGMFVCKDSVRFSKLGSQFITILINGLRKFEEAKTFKSDYKEVFEKYNTNIEEVNQAIDIWYLSNQDITLDISKIIKTLDNISNQANILSVKVKDNSKKRSLVNDINNLKKEIQNSILNQKG